MLLLGDPSAVVIHFWLTTKLTPEESRIWIHELTASNLARALATYLECPDRAAAARRLAEDASARRRNALAHDELP
jgi:hypothetical protein